MKLEDSGANFLLDGVSYAKDSARAFVVSTHVGLAVVGSQHDNLAAHSIFSEWTDLTDTPYVSKAALLTAMQTICFTTFWSLREDLLPVNLYDLVEHGDNLGIAEQGSLLIPKSIVNPSHFNTFWGYADRPTAVTNITNAITLGGALLP